MSDGFKIEIKGIEELKRTFNQIEKDIMEAVAEGVHDGGDIIKLAAKEKVHVISSDLKNSIDELHSSESGSRIEVQVGSPLPYATVEEFRVGGKYPGSHSYMRYALDNNEKAAVAAIEKKIEAKLARFK